MNQGLKVKVISLIAPHGTIYESLRKEHEKGIVGRIEGRAEPDGWYAVKFPGIEGAMHVHRTMLEPVR